MARLKRIKNKIFGATASTTGSAETGAEIGQFGSALAGTYNATSDVEQIQGLPAYEKGFIGAVIPDMQYPTLPEMTGVNKVLSYQTGYLFQEGIPEWDKDTEYYTNSIVKIKDKLFISIKDNNVNKNPASEKVYWKTLELGGGGSSLPVGTIIPVSATSNYVPENCLPCDGSEYTKAQFPDLWQDFLVVTKRLETCTYSEYQQDITTNGACAKFGIDTAKGMFKVPLIPDGYYIKKGQGTANKAGLPNITGHVEGNGFIDASFDTTTGALKGGKSRHRNWSQSFGDENSLQALDLNASWSNPIYGASDTVETNAVAYRYFIVVATGSIKQSEMDWSQWASGLQGKANTDLANTTAKLADSFISKLMPDYSKGFGFEIAPSSPFIAPSDGFIMGNYAGDGGSLGILYINGQKVAEDIPDHSCSPNIPVTKGDKLTCNIKDTGGAERLFFFPLKGAI